MRELVFNVTQEDDGGFCAKSVGEGIYTQGDTWNELCHMVVDATQGYFYVSEPPTTVRLCLHVEQVLQIQPGSALIDDSQPSNLTL
jgi:hypothetical protein